MFLSLPTSVSAAPCEATNLLVRNEAGQGAPSHVERLPEGGQGRLFLLSDGTTPDSQPGVAVCRAFAVINKLT